MHTGPNIKVDNLILAIDAVNHKSYKADYNMIDISSWADGQEGGAIGITQYSSNNRRAMGIDPWGNEIVVWESYSTSSTAGGGMYVVPRPVDNSKMYRISFWEKRISNSTATNAMFYFGCNASGTVDGLLKKSTASNQATNTYFWSTNMPTFNNDWYLVVGHVWPAGTPAGPNHEDSGIHSKNGRIGNITSDYTMIPETSSLRGRTLSIYQPNALGVLHHSAYPRMDVCDGTEPTLSELINGDVQIWNGLINENKIDVAGAVWSEEGYFSFRGQGTPDGLIEGDNLNGFENVADTRLYNKGMSISWWMRLGESPGSRQCVFFGAKTTNHIEFINLNGNSPSFRTEAVNNGYSFGSGVIPGGSLVGKWVNFVVVFDFTTSPRSVKWYKDGEIFYSHTNFDSGASGSNEYFSFSSFGRSTGSTTYNYASSFKGDLAKLNIYGGPLNGKEVEDNYLAFKSRFQ